MKALAPAVLICPKCETYFSSFATFYAACNCGPPLQCPHGDVRTAMYHVRCPSADCDELVEDSEPVERTKR